MEDVTSTTASLVAAVARGDAVAAAELYLGDGRLLTPWSGLLSGRREIEEYWRAGFSVGVEALELELLEVEQASVMSFELGRYGLAVAGNRGTREVGTYLVLHRRRTDGSWGRAVDVFIPDKEER